MKKTNAIAANFDENAVKEDLEKHINNLTNDKLNYLKKWMKDKPIDVFTDASIAISTKDKAKNAAVDAVKSVAWAAVGVKAKYRRVETISHLILSNDHLHFVDADVDGNLQTHLTFTPDQLSNAKIEYRGPKKGVDLASGITDTISKKLNKEENMINVFAITFKGDKEELTIQAHDKVVLPFEMYEMGSNSYTEDSMIANVICKTFFEKLAEKYPNLKASKAILVS
ncbi:hypothetical protein [Tenacibaculum sp. M341]|uniref:hypothetical protein n=1 Tax=Tenacibaculum sp. M341 TaxID=2530339 RepID=UPI001051EA07|nr:hypothetical protein [Tenacibaculum sp. M341]TCI91342.1 hypothetical protein EYW44_10320 [Tenacibaculum sp. M341]